MRKWKEAEEMLSPASAGLNDEYAHRGHDLANAGRAVARCEAGLGAVVDADWLDSPRQGAADEPDQDGCFHGGSVLCACHRRMRVIHGPPSNANFYNA